MRFRIDHDYHIHSRLSRCSGCPEQTPENMLKYAERNGISRMILTDHFWDETIPSGYEWYEGQDYPHVSQNLPLPQSDKVSFKFGCETDMDKNFRIGITKETMEKFDFVIIPTTHVHMKNFTYDVKDESLLCRRALYVHRLARLLEMDLPRRKIGLAHQTCELIAPPFPEGACAFEDHIRLLDGISDTTYLDLFRGVAEKEIGVELNIDGNSLLKYSKEQLESVLRPFFFAKEAGCKFYLGSDAHDPKEMQFVPEKFIIPVEYLGLEESDMFLPACFDDDAGKEGF